MAQTLVRDDLLDEAEQTLHGRVTKMVTAPYSAEGIRATLYIRLEHFVRRNGERVPVTIDGYQYLIDAGLSDMSKVCSHDYGKFVVESELNKHCSEGIIGLWKILECDRRSAGTHILTYGGYEQFSTSVMAIPRPVMIGLGVFDIISVSNDKSSPLWDEVTTLPYVIDH
ncbi:hypothetical protein SPFM6_00243 [Salmonella phage SPFM6]|nr:hypothetical protein SPFM6_00243 [Salmonella phage SPFM6]